MGFAFALTLPGLVIALVAYALVLQIRATRPGVKRATASPALDVLATLLSPADRHRIAEQHRQELTRDDVEDGAPPRSRVDLESGTAHLLIPKAK